VLGWDNASKAGPIREEEATEVEPEEEEPAVELEEEEIEELKVPRRMNWTPNWINTWDKTRKSFKDNWTTNWTLTCKRAEEPIPTTEPKRRNDLLELSNTHENNLEIYSKKHRVELPNLIGTLFGFEGN